MPSEGKLKGNLSNPSLQAIIEEIETHPVYLEFLTFLKQYGINLICDFHAHVSSGREETIPNASPDDLAELPENPFSLLDINRFYNSLFRKEGIGVCSVVFDTPLHAYDLSKKNKELLTRLSLLEPEEAKRLIPFAIITPEMEEREIGEYVEQGAKGFKITPRTTRSYLRRRRISEVNLNEMLNPKALKIAHSLGLPLLVHLPLLMSATEINPGLKEELGRIITTYPNLKLVLAHLGLAQSPFKFAELLRWIEENGFEEIIWLDISTITIPSVLEMAFSSKVKLLFGTDMDFSLTERGRYVMVKRSGEEKILADEETQESVKTVLVSNSFGKEFRELVLRRGIEINAPLFIFQLEGIMKAVERLREKGKAEEELKEILTSLFYRQAQSILRLDLSSRAGL